MALYVEPKVRIYNGHKMLQVIVTLELVYVRYSEWIWLASLRHSMYRSKPIYSGNSKIPI